MEAMHQAHHHNSNLTKDKAKVDRAVISNHPQETITKMGVKLNQVLSYQQYAKTENKLSKQNIFIAIEINIENIRIYRIFFIYYTTFLK